MNIALALDLLTMKKPEEKALTTLLEAAGIAINGTRPWDISVHNPKFYARCLKDGSLGAGEAYMQQWWDCERLDLLFERIARAHLEEKINIPWRVIFKNLLAKIINLQSKRRAKQVGSHYNLGNNLFKAMLDEQMIYSCAYFKDTADLAAAQMAKLELICKKLNLQAGMHLLDIGCGWGGLAKYAAIHYGVKVTGITIAKQQYEWAKASCKGLDIEIKLQDYREIEQTFDRIVSVGMFEHVGFMNYRTFMQLVARSLKDNGLFLLHTIGNNQTNMLADPWIRKYIFPNGMLPSIQQIGQAIEPFFVMEDWQNFGAYYDKTLLAWHENFTRHWGELRSFYDETFYRMWAYYLLSCAGYFRAREMQLWQIVLSKGVDGVYIAPR
ncbi:cyclopropane fatty acyl phospholipid synthase [Legionella sp. 27cVA30]